MAVGNLDRLSMSVFNVVSVYYTVKPQPREHICVVCEGHFSIFQKFIKNSNNIPSISKTIQHIAMTWCTYLDSFEEIQQCVFELV